MTLKTVLRKQMDVLLFLFFIMVSFALFYSVIPLTFFSDDYLVLYRLTIEKTFLPPGFFRPLSDLSLLLNYYLGGYDANGYRVLNVLLHGINAFLLFKVIGKAGLLFDRQNYTLGIIAALLFVTYPFHAEPVIWIVGRGSLLAATFGISALYAFVSNLTFIKKTGLMCLFYFIGLAAYESIMLLPAIIFVAILFAKKNTKSAFSYTLPLVATLVVHLIVRWMVAEAIIGEYGKEVYGEGFSNYALKFVKSFGKLFIYPQHNSQSFVLFFSGVLLLISSSFIVMFYYRREHFPGYTFLWLALVIAHIIPGFFGVDTHTSDGERLLYFPSFFVCAALAFAICSFIPSKTRQAFMLLLLLVCNVYYLEKGKKNWIKADAAINNINYSLKQFSGKPLYLINIPDAIDGSFVYRNGFREAMAVNQISDSNITVVNYLLNKDAHLLNNIISPSLVSSSAMRIPPVVKVSEGSIDINTLRKDGWHKKRIQRKKGSTVLFWNGTKIVLLQ